MNIDNAAAAFGRESKPRPAVTRPLVGRHYLAVGGTNTAVPLLPMDALVVINLTDGSGELTLSAEYDFKENVYLSGGLLLGVGPEPETAGGVPTRYRAEFGVYPQTFYAQVKLYF